MRSPSRRNRAGLTGHSRAGVTGSVASRERGSVTAEFATAMPAVILVLALCLATGQLASQQLNLQDAAAAAARGISRGDAAATVNQRITQRFPGAEASRADRNGLSCVTVRSPAALGPSTFTLTATSCALKEPGW